MRSVSKCLRINQDTISEERGEDKGEGGNPFRDAVTAMLNSLESTLTLVASKGWTGRHRHGGGGPPVTTNTSDPSYPYTVPSCTVTYVTSNPRGQRLWRGCSRTSTMGLTAEFPGRIWRVSSSPWGVVVGAGVVGGGVGVA